MMALMLSALVWQRLQVLSWPLRLIWIGIFVGFFVNLFASRLWNVERRWQKIYLWKSAICFVSAVYFFTSIFGLLGPGVLISLLRWVFPLFAFSMSISALMHIFEWRALKEKLRS